MRNIRLVQSYLQCNYSVHWKMFIVKYTGFVGQRTTTSEDWWCCRNIKCEETPLWNSLGHTLYNDLHTTQTNLHFLRSMAWINLLYLPEHFPPWNPHRHTWSSNKYTQTSCWEDVLSTFDCQKPINTTIIINFFIYFHDTGIQILQRRRLVAVLVQMW